MLFQSYSRGFTAHYYRVAKGADTAAYIVVNVNKQDLPPWGAETSANGYSLSVSQSPIEGGTHHGWWSKLSVADPSSWNLMSVFSSGSLPDERIVCFPNPFDPEQSDLYFTARRAFPGQAEQALTIYSSAMRVMYSGTVPIQKVYGNDCAVWNGKDREGGLLASGVYLYALSNGEGVVKGKFAVIRRR